MDRFIFDVDENNNAAIRISAGQGETNQKDIFTTDENGNAAIRVVGSGGGGGVDYKKIIIKSSTIPTADSTTYRDVYMYVGETDANYTHGYIYECQKTSATYTGTVTFEAATLSETTVTCDGDDFANFLTEAGADPTPIVSGTMTFESDANGWRLVGKDSNGDTVTTFLEYVEDYQDAGFTFTGTPQDGDVIAFTCTVEEASATYAWTRIDVQPAPSGLPDQTGQSGKFLTTNGTDASWSDIVPQTSSSSARYIYFGDTTERGNDKTGAIAIGYTPFTNGSIGSYSVSIGDDANGKGQYGIAIGNYSTVGSNASGGIAIGMHATANGANSIQLGYYGTNNDAKTVKISYSNNENYEMMSADGTIPAARHASLPATDGTYVLKLVISGGVPTLSWVAE